MDPLSVRRVANGWIIAPGQNINDFTHIHIAATPEDLAEHILKWAKAQIVDVRFPTK